MVESHYVLTVNINYIKWLIEAITSLYGTVGYRDKDVPWATVTMPSQQWLTEFSLINHNILLGTIMGNPEFLSLVEFTTARQL